MSRFATVLSTVQTKLTGLTTTGGNVFVNRFYAEDQGVPTHLNIRRGDVLARDIDERGVGFLDWEMTVNVEIRTMRNSESASLLDTIWAEVHAAMMADRTLGLSYVGDVIPSDAGPVEGDTDLEQQVTGTTLTYIIRVRTEITSLT